MAKQQPVSEDLEDEDYQEGVWVPNEDVDEAIDALEAMTSFLKLQHQGAIELTRLTLEHCKFESITEEKIFNIYQQAIQLLQKNMKNPIK